MKKLKYVLFLFIFVFTTGFTRCDISMNIVDNKEMDFTIVLLSDSQAEITDSVTKFKNVYEKYDYEITEYENNGIKISKKVDNIDNISFGKRADEFDLLYLFIDNYNHENDVNMFNVDKQFDTNRYASNFYVNISNNNINLNAATITYNLTLPKATVSNNANYVSEDGTKLTWNISPLAKTEIDFVFELKSYDTIYYIVAIIIAVFLVFAIISSLFSKSEEGNSDHESVTRSNRDYDAQRRVEHLTQNAINRNNNLKNYNSTNDVYSNNKSVNTKIDNPIPTVKPQVNDNDITNFKVPDTKMKKLFGKLKNDNKKEFETKTINDNVNANTEFNNMVNTVNNADITNNSNNIVNVDNELNSINSSNTISVVDNENNETEISFNNIPAVPIIKNNGILDINNSSDSILNDTVEEPIKQEIVEEKEEQVINDVPTIKFNNKDIVIKKNDEEEN